MVLKGTSQDAKDHHACSSFKTFSSMIGIDLISTPRMKRFMERFGDKALERFLSPPEMTLVKGHRTAAGFWAAKEACSKALGTGISAECGFHDMTISKSSRGAPMLSLSKELMKRFNIVDISLSITHDGDYAIAVVAIERSGKKVEQ